MTTQFLDLLPPDLRDKVEAGEYFIADPSTWYSEAKPVVRSKATGGLVKGTGKVAGSKDAAVASKATAALRTLTYSQEMAEFLPTGDLKDHPKAIMGWAEFVQRLMDAALGTPQKVRCQHEGCTEFHLVAMKPDPGVLFKIYENRVGKAKETQEINVSSQHISMVLNERTAISDVQVRAIPVEVIEERQRIVDEAQ